jgi:hypothetical protein
MPLIYRSAELSLGGNALRLEVAARVVAASLFVLFVFRSIRANMIERASQPARLAASSES